MISLYLNTGPSLQTSFPLPHVHCSHSPIAQTILRSRDTCMRSAGKSRDKSALTAAWIIGSGPHIRASVNLALPHYANSYSGKVNVRHAVSGGGMTTLISL